MRTLLLAGTAMMFMGGVALAQSAGGTAPAANGSTMGTGAANGSTMGSGAAKGSTMGSGAGQMAPQNQPGTNASNGTVSGNAMTGPAGVAKPETMNGGHSSGMASKRPMNKGAMNKGSMDKTSMGKGSMGHSSMGRSSSYISHRMGGGMPVNQSAGQYMQIAQKAVMAHNKMRAHDALGRAETDLLSNSYVQGSVNGPISTPAISDIRGARRAVNGGNYRQASMMIHKAMADMHGQMGSNSTMGHSGGMNDAGRTGMMNNAGNTGMMNKAGSAGMMNNAGNTGMTHHASGMMGQSGTSDQSTMSNGSSAGAMPGANPQAGQNSTMHNSQMTKPANGTTN